MAAHTYWRLYIGAMANVYAQMGTVSFLNAAQVNQSIGGAATASSEYSVSWAAGNAFDGNPASEWASAGLSRSEWIAYQHPSPVDIVFVGVKVFVSYPVSGLALQYSDDGVSWSDASPLYVLAGQPALDSGSYTVLWTGTSRRPLVLVGSRTQELPEGDTLPPQTPAAHSHATSDVAGLDAALAGKEPTIAAGTTAQYWRGNKTWQTLNKSAVGLGNVDNTSDANKPISTATQSALNEKAPLLQPTLTGLREVRVAMAANNIDVATGNLFTKTISGTTTLTVSNVPSAGTVATFILKLTNGGSATVNWFSGVKWPGGTAPTLTASGRDTLYFETDDGGTTWDGSFLKDIK